MRENRQRFADELTKGVGAIRAQEGKLVEIIHGELAVLINKKESAIANLRKGRLQIPQPKEVECLAREIVKRGRLDQKWLEEFLRSAGYSATMIASVRAEIFPPENLPGSGHELAVKPTPLPTKNYQQLIGRDHQITEILDKFQTQNFIHITGLGGIGKTSLAHEVADVCLQRQLCEAVVWTHAKVEFFHNTRIEVARSAEYDFEFVLNEIGRQLSGGDISHLSLEKKRERVRALLQQSQVLIVMDNLDLEVVSSPEHVVHQVWQLIGRGKLLTTGRYRLSYDQAYLLTLTGLHEEDSLRFLAQEGEYRGVAAIRTADQATLRQIHRATGGAPLAMKLVVGLLDTILSVSKVLELVQEASHAAKSDSYEFYRFLYWHSWNLLEDRSKELLVDLSVFAPVVGGAVEDIVAISDLEMDDFWLAVQQLTSLSLIERPSVSTTQNCYALHPLTYYFVLSDIRQKWNHEPAPI